MCLFSSSCLQIPDPVFYGRIQLSGYFKVEPQSPEPISGLTHLYLTLNMLVFVENLVCTKLLHLFCNLDIKHCGTQNPRQPAEKVKVQREWRLLHSAVSPQKASLLQFCHTKDQKPTNTCGSSSTSATSEKGGGAGLCLGPCEHLIGSVSALQPSLLVHMCDCLCDKGGRKKRRM